jgi:hypothetical protein
MNSGATAPSWAYGKQIVAKSTSTTLSWSEMTNSIVRTTAAVTHTLQAIDAAHVGIDFEVEAVGAYTVCVDPNASDRLRLVGTALTDGNKVCTSGATGDKIRVYGDSTDGYTVECNALCTDSGA